LQQIIQSLHLVFFKIFPDFATDWVENQVKNGITITTSCILIINDMQKEDKNGKTQNCSSKTF